MPVDVHSYDEDMMVEDPNLVQHLRHFGINMMVMEKVCMVKMYILYLKVKYVIK